MTALAPPRHPLRHWLTPLASTVAGSALGLLPWVVNAPALPACGLLMALGWRFLRPELWPPWMALPLGAADDLIGGAPLGTAMALWTVAFLAVDLAEHRPMWRDHWLHWAFAAACVVGVGIGGWALAAFVAGGGGLWPLAPQLLLGALLFPVAARLCARLDQWRLR